MTITKAQIVEAIADQTGFPNHKSSKIVENLLELVKNSLESGEDVLISGFGKFCVTEKRERRGLNPATGEDMMLGRKRVVIFSCSEKLNDKANG